MVTLYALAAAFGIGVLWLGTTIKVVKQFERGVVFRFGRVQSGLRGPGLTMLIPIADRLEKVNMQIITMPVPAQDGITRDNVTVRVDAVIYFQVSDPVRAAVDCRTTCRLLARLHRHHCVRSSARAIWTTCCPTASISIRVWS